MLSLIVEDLLEIIPDVTKMETFPKLGKNQATPKINYSYLDIDSEVVIFKRVCKHPFLDE